MKKFFAAAIFSLMAVAAHDAHAQPFTEQVVHYPGSFFTSVYGINDRGEVVGGYDIGNSFIFDGANFRPFDAVNGSPMGINNHGQIIGIYADGAFLYDGRDVINISYPGAMYSHALDINNNGQVLGSYVMDDWTRHNYIYDNGTFTTFDLSFNGMDAFAAGFNDLGDLAGAYSTGPGWYDFQGFIYSDGEFTSVDHPFSGEVDSTFLADINNSGQALGGYTNDLLESTNFIYEGGEFHELPSMYTDRTYVYAINNLGQVSGSFYGPYQGQYDDIDHGFIISPDFNRSTRASSVPEPSTALLLGGTIASLFHFRKKISA